LLKDVLDRAAAINTDPTLLHYVTELRVFGSYCTDAANLGDLDLAFKLERRKVEGKWTDACLALAQASGRSFKNFLDELFYPEQLVKRTLKCGSRHISLHTTEELDENPEFGGKTVYRFKPPRGSL
jgi:predicted nucleotidyltransferase